VPVDIRPMIKSIGKTPRLGLNRPFDLAPQALVALVTDDADTARPLDGLSLRGQVSPLADWVRVDVGNSPLAQRQKWLRHQLCATLSRKHMGFNQLVVLGWHNTARLVLDLVLKGAMTCAGIILVDVPCSSPRQPIAATQTSIRIILHEGQNASEIGLIADLRRHDADMRLLNLPSGSMDAGEATLRATATFLSELTAKACRQSPATKDTGHV